MKKNIVRGIAAVVISTLMSITAFAGIWQQDTVGAWYLSDSGSYPANGWYQIDGYVVHFNESGYLDGSDVTSIEDLSGRYEGTEYGSSIIDVIPYADGSGYYVEASTVFRENAGYVEGPLMMITGSTGVVCGDGCTLMLTWDNQDYFTVQESGSCGGMGCTLAGSYSYLESVEAR